MIIAENITKKFGDFLALDKVDLQVKKGSIFGLVGPNGSGKTTLIKILTGVYKKDTGNVYIDEQSVYENIEIKGKIAYIPDELYFFPAFTIKAMAKFYSQTFKDFNWERYEKLKTVLKLKDNMRISKLSKGMKKQVAFWLSIASMPDVMILDEPIDGLDPVMRKQIWSLILQEVAERQLTVLISSHNLRELEDVCDCIGILHKGKLLLTRELDELKSDIHKIQIAFQGEFPKLGNHIKILKKEKAGSIYTLIIKGDLEDIKKELLNYSPVLVDFIRLTLEEIFIYETGGVGYEVSEILL